MRAVAAVLFGLLFTLPVYSAKISASKKGKVPATKRAKARVAVRPLDPAAIQDLRFRAPLVPKSSGAAVIRAQILLHRVHFSTGEIDGFYGVNTQKAVVAFQSSRSIPATGVIDSSTWEQLNADASPALVVYTITEQDTAGPFAKIPEDMMDKAELPALGYSSVLEALGERFHIKPELLVRLNRGKKIDAAGVEIMVPNTMTSPPPRAASVAIRASDSSVTALDSEGKTLARYPASIGSEHDPLPVGKWKILGIRKDPDFNYNPALFWDAKPQHAKAKLAPGPNNPVGVVWIDLSKEHYGIHGTPEPSTIGRTQSHGCIRLTNWDAAELASIVGPGTPAILEK